MSQVVFDEPTYRKSRANKKERGLLNLFIRLGLATNKQGAIKVSLIIIVLCVVATVVLLNMGTKAATPIDSPEDLYYDGPNTRYAN